MATTLEDIQLELEIANQEDDKFRSVVKQESTFNQEMRLEQLSVLQGILGVLKDSFDFDKLLALKKSREIEGGKQEEENESSSGEGPTKVEAPTKLLEILGAIAGFVTGFVAELGLIFKTAIKFLRENSVLKFVESLFKSIGKMFRSIGKMFTSEGKIAKLFQESKIVKSVAEFFRVIRSSVGSLVETSKALFTESKIAAFVGKFFKAIQVVVESLVTMPKFIFEGTAIEAKFLEFTTAIKGQVGKIVSKGGEIFRAVSNGLGKALEGTKAVFKGVGGRIVGIFTESFKGLAEISKTIEGGGKLSKLFKPVTDFFTMFKTVGGAMGKAFGKLLPPVLLIMEVVETIKGAFSFASEEIENGGNFIQVGIAGIIGAFTGFVNFFLEIPDMLLHAVSWISEKLFGPENPVTKFLDSFSLVDLFTDFMKGVKDFVNHPLDSIKLVVRTLTDAVGDFVKMVINGIVNFDPMSIIDDPIGTVIGVVMAPYTLLKNAVAWILGKLGFDDVSESLKSFSIVDTVKTIINAPFDLLTSAVAWVAGKLGFDDLAEDVKGFNFVDAMNGIIMAPIKLLGKAVDFVLDKLGFPSLAELIPDVSGPLKEMADWLSGMIDAGIQWVKDKLSFFGGDSEKKNQKDLQKQLESEGIVKKEGGFAGFGGTMTIDDETLRALSDKELQKVWEAYHDNPDLAPKLQDEAERRKAEYRKMESEKPDPVKEAEDKLKLRKQELGSLNMAIEEGEDVSAEDLKRAEQRVKLSESNLRNKKARAEKEAGTLQTALQPQDIVEVDEKYTPSAIISGTQQQAVAQSDEMRASQAVYDENKGPVRQGGDVNTSVNAPTTNNQTINNSYLQSNQPSARDDTDQMYIFRATGTSR